MQYVIYENQRFYATPFTNYYISKAGKVLVNYRGGKVWKYKQIHIDHDGYATTSVSYYINGQHKVRSMYVHKLMALTFLGSRPKGCVVDHINHNKLDNSLRNLRYISNQENIARSHRGVKPRLKIPAKLRLDGKTYTFPSIRQMMAFLGLKGGVFTTMKSGLYKQIRGYRIKRAEEVNRVAYLTVTHVSNDQS